MVMGIKCEEKLAVVQKFPMSNFKMKPISVELSNLYAAKPKVLEDSN